MNKPAARGPRGRMAPAASLRDVDMGVVRRLMGYIWQPYKLRFALVLLCLLVSALTNVAGFLFLRTLIDDYITPLLRASEPDFSALLGAVLRMGCVYLAGILAAFTQNRLMVTISQGVLKTIRDDMFAHMQGLPISYFDSHAYGDVMSFYTNDTDTLRQVVSQTIPQLFNSAITIVTVLAAMFSLSVPLTLFTLAFVCVSLFVSRGIAGKSGGYFVAQQRALAGLNGYIEEMIEGQKVVKVFCHERESEAAFDARNESLRENAGKAHAFANILMPIMANLGHLLYVLVAVAGGALALGGAGVSLGVIASFLPLTKSFSMPINQIAQQFNSAVMALAGAARIFALLDEAPESDAGTVQLVCAKRGADGGLEESDCRSGLWAWKRPGPSGEADYTEVRGDVRFKEVDFAYVPGKTVLHDVSLYARPGQKIAFVGATGAGKTTITNLINRFYDLEDGRITYDGININDIKKSDLRRSQAYVLQDIRLFTGSVRENIRYGKLDATDEEVVAAAKLANAHDFIMRLPQGYDTQIEGDGESLSQGQRQLLSIARAAVADPPVMILDEATSSIDTRTESLVQKGMDSLMQGRTVFVIAHRLSTVRDAQAIMVLEKGRIVERGNHEQLMAEKGRYYRLYSGTMA